MSTTRYPYRCHNRFADGTRCQTRLTMARRVEQYVRVPRCPKCRSKLHWWLDIYRKAKKDRKTRICYCDAYPHPHDKASQLCEQRPGGPDLRALAEREHWTDEQYEVAVMLDYYDKHMPVDMGRGFALL